MIWAEHFTALIQLISAVNFVYIATHFPNRVYSMVFDENKLLKDKFLDFTSEISADLQSLESMSPITTDDGKTNEGKIRSLQKQYKTLKEQWDKEQEIILCEISNAKNVKGSKSLFLYVSLFCVLSLFNISLLSLFDCDFILFYTLILNVGVMVYSIYLSYIVWTHKWDGKSDEECYRKTCMIFLVTLLVSLITPTIIHCIVPASGGMPIPSIVFTIIISLCVFLPFYPCILSIIFILCHEAKIKKMTGNETKQLKTKQSQLHGEKLDLDKIGNMFTIPNWPDVR